MSISSRTTSRRDFLAVGATAVGVCAISALRPSQLLAAAPTAKSKLHIGLCTYEWGKDWNIPTLIANCQKAGLYGIEPRTDLNYAHGIELTLNAAQRAEVKRQFADSPVRIDSIACGEHMDWPQPERLRAAVEKAKLYLQLSHDVGCDTLRVFPNEFHPDVPHEKTIAQIARALDELAVTAAGLGQEVSLEAHGPAGDLVTMRAVMDQVTRPNVRIRLNSDIRDTKGKGFVANFNLVKDRLSRIIHLRDLTSNDYPYQTMVNLLAKMNWEGCANIERSDPVADRVAAMTEQRQVWEAMVEKAQRSAAT